MPIWYLNHSPLFVVSFRGTAHGGDESTVNVGSYNSTDPGLKQNHGPSYRQIIDWDHISSSVFVTGPGQSGHILSKNYDSMVDQWGNVEYEFMTMNPEIEDTLTLYPSTD